MEVDKEQAKETLRLWKEMSEVFVQIRYMKFTVLEDYLKFRVFDAGCPWTICLLCFSMDFKLSPEEDKRTANITSAAYYSWVLVNDYFSWEKEWSNYQSNGATGEEGKKMLRKEIMSREDKHCSLKDEFLAKGAATEKTRQWLELLDLVTAGNFAWSMRQHDIELAPRMCIRLCGNIVLLAAAGEYWAAQDEGPDPQTETSPTPHDHDDP
ncbi:Terpenoid synthase [Fusarium tjaetaba]|uniref:Terpenoid synthase n=1 Tax=Fusarium tjaetaba TaxID=1567544 RepID=A0A8H5VL21_9HYPO|nr:Terpenoid synthase [Fusarium tjaetaba]KAF5627286.1 Terpenoid synthase [Fusarium tjaetaba]